jgi:hypothetical protein
MRINIKIKNPAKTGSFADTKLSFTDKDGTLKDVNLNISFQTLKDFSNDTSSVAFDLFFISTLVYGIDNLLDRYKYSIDAWAREIEVCFPVNNLQTWLDNQNHLEEILTFLTGDYWSISFVQLNDVNLFKDKARRWQSTMTSYDLSEYSFVSLFSGGLDSLIGIIDGLHNLGVNEKGLLVSHFDSTSPGANSDQKKIESSFSSNVFTRNKYKWLQSIVSLNNHDTIGNEISKEPSFRSRSLLFIGIGVFCVEHLPNCRILTIPENGTISLNYPLTPSRTSTLSTRTTHPFYLAELQKFLLNIGLTTKLFNPYSYLTKGELVESCQNFALLRESYILSVSCGKRGRKMHWDNKIGTSHCGICMPCIYRRAALHKKGLDTQLYGIDIFNTIDSNYKKHDFPALFDFLKSNLTNEQIKRTLIVAGSIDFSQLDVAASLVEKVRTEIKQWISDKGSNELKKLAGIR